MNNSYKCPPPPRWKFSRVLQDIVPFGSVPLLKFAEKHPKYQSRARVSLTITVP